MPGTETFVQVAPDGTGKKVRNFDPGSGLLQQTVNRAKSDGTLLDDEATETTLAAIKAKTDNLDVLLSTRTKPGDTQPISAASLPLPTGTATEATLGTVAKDSTVAKDATLATLAKDATLGVVGATPGAYTVLDRLGQIGLKLDADIAVQKQILAAVQPRSVAKATTTLLHRS